MRPQRVWFSAVFFINRVSILAIVVINRIWFLHFCHQLEMFCLNKGIELFGHVINRVGKIAHFNNINNNNNNNNNYNNNNFIYIALKSNNCPKRYLITILE